MQLGPLFEVIVYCSDMQKQVEFYRDTLGLAVAWPEKDDYSGEHWVQLASEGAILALHSGGQATTGTPTRFGFRTSDIHGDREALLDKGVRCGDVREAAPGVQVADCWDPEATPFFLEQREEKY